MTALNVDTINYIVSLAREVQQDAPDIIEAELAESHDSEFLTTDDIAQIADEGKMEDHAQDTTYQAFVGAVKRMNEEERNELVALMWVGRGTYGKDEWEQAVAAAAEASNDHTADYLMRAPLLPDYLEEGLAQMEDLLEEEE
ncbi:DUF3775 domain-containing protein [Emcibacter sp.]|uniref:DUF3775 domain-containing protein n=1 Tax=Emcibacter sp. TaxID=1979954 RepID=UPI002AA6CE4D|nr:DUF3775 domain-containing protein [Emcibacter sp.]